MLEVVINFLPHGNRAFARPLAILTVINDCSGTKERGNYNISLFRDTDNLARGVPSKGRIARIKDWPREEKDAVALVHEALGKLLAEQLQAEEETRRAAAKEEL